MRTNPIFLVLLVCIFLSAEGQGKTCPISSSARNLVATSFWQDLKSPGFDTSGYSNDVRCTWYINSQDPQRPVRLEALVMQLEVISRCTYDFVEIFDSSGSRGKYCNLSVPVITSQGNPLRIQFETDSSATRKGFHFRYKIENSSSGAVSSPISECSSQGYSVEATGEEKYIQSTNYPLSYPNNLDCKWILRALTDGYVIKVVVHDSNLESSSTCSLDYVTAYDGPSDSSMSLKTWCDTQTPTFFSTGQYLTLRFVTDSSIQRSGFKLSFKEVSVAGNPLIIEQCRSEGFTVEATGEEKYIQSTNYPLTYPKNLDCKWFLRTQTSGYVVMVVVQDSHLESLSSCSYDYVAAYDGPSDGSTQLQKWCGTQTPTLYSSGQYLTLRFVTDSSSQETGFKLSFKEVPESQRPSGLSSGAITGIVIAVLAPLLVCFFCCCCYHCQKKKPGGACSSTAPPRGMTTTSSAPNSGANHQVFYTSTYAPSVGQPTVTNPTSPSAYAPPTYPGPPSQHYPVQNPAYPVGGYAYPQPSAPPQLGGMGGPVAPPPERQESLPSEPPPPYWQASQYQLHPGGNTSAGTAAEGGSGGGQLTAGGGQLVSGGGQLTAGGGQTTSGSGHPTAGYRDNPAYIPDGN